MKKQQDYFEFLDELRETGACNMYGAACYLHEAFPELNTLQARTVLQNWMDDAQNGKRR